METLRAKPEKWTLKKGGQLMSVYTLSDLQRVLSIFPWKYSPTLASIFKRVWGTLNVLCDRGQVGQLGMIHCLGCDAEIDRALEEQERY